MGPFSRDYGITEPYRARNRVSKCSHEYQNNRTGDTIIEGVVDPVHNVLSASQTMYQPMYGYLPAETQVLILHAYARTMINHRVTSTVFIRF